MLYKYLYKQRFLIISFLMMLFSISFLSTDSMASLKIKYNGKTTKYTGKQIVSYVDDKKISAEGTKGLLLNKKVMVSYKDIFKKGCKVKVKYTKSTGKITFLKNGKSVKMTIGKKKCTVNGKKVKLSHAPVKVKYIKKNKTKILVPAKTVAKGLGYTYVYNSSQKNIKMLSPFVLSYNGEEHIYKSYQGGLIFDNVTRDVSNMPLLKIDSTVMMPAKEVLTDIMGVQFEYNPSNGNIIITNDYYKLTLNTSTTAGELTDLDTSTVTPLVLKTKPVLVKRTDTGYESVMLPASQVLKSIGYHYKWDTKLKIASIYTKTYFVWKSKDNTYEMTKYKNAMNKVIASYDLDNNNLVLSFSFVNPIAEGDGIITEDTNLNNVYIDFANMFNLLSGYGTNLTSSTVNSILSEQSDANTHITLSVPDKITYSYSISGNTYNMYISQNVNKNYALKINKPDGVDYSQILLDDLYTNNKFVISIPGKYDDFYAANPVQNNSSTVTSVSVAYVDSKKTTDITVTTSKLQGNKLVNLGNSIGVIIDYPANVYKNIVVLDPGHGGKDPGAKNGEHSESNINLQILYDQARNYFNSAESNVKAYWTRTTDEFITLQNRANFASKMNADFFVSLHMNSSDSGSAKGTEVYYSNNNNKTNSFGINSYKLATKCLDKIVPAISTSSRGVKSNNYYVINHNTVPAVLIELGFISNSTDLGIITDADKQKLAAKAIYDAVSEAFNSKE